MALIIEIITTILLTVAAIIMTLRINRLHEEVIKLQTLELLMNEVIHRANARNRKTDN